VTFDELPDVLTVEEFAKFARIGRRQAYAAVDRGDVYGARIGRAIPIPKSAVTAFLEGRRNENGEQPRPLLAVVEGGHGHGRRSARG
jgi:excisionase family DNA binding protein